MCRSKTCQTKFKEREGGALRKNFGENRGGGFEKSVRPQRPWRPPRATLDVESIQCAAFRCTNESGISLEVKKLHVPQGFLRGFSGVSQGGGFLRGFAGGSPRWRAPPPGRVLGGGARARGLRARGGDGGPGAAGRVGGRAGQ